MRGLTPNPFLPAASRLLRSLALLLALALISSSAGAHEERPDRAQISSASESLEPTSLESASPQRRVFSTGGDNSTVLFVPQAIWNDPQPESALLTRGELEEVQKEIFYQNFFRRWHETGSLAEACREGGPPKACGVGPTPDELAASLNVPRQYAENIIARYVDQLRREKEQRTPEGCRVGSVVEGPVKQDTPEQFAEFGDLVFLGIVTDTVAGWQMIENRSATMVFVEVTEVLRDEAAKLWAGRIVAFVEHHGVVTIDGVSLCTVPPPAIEPLIVGDTLLVQAYPNRHSTDNRLLRALVSPVRDGRIEGRAANHPFFSAGVSEVRDCFDAENEVKNIVAGTN